MTTPPKPAKKGLVLRRPPGTRSISDRSEAPAQTPSPTPTPAPAAPKQRLPAEQSERIPAGLPKVYADLAMDVVYGLHTTKIVLGEETGSNSARPVAVVVIPTGSLLVRAKAAIPDLTSPSMINETAERYAGILATMRETKVE